MTADYTKTPCYLLYLKVTLPGESEVVSFFAVHFKAIIGLYLVSDETSPLALSVPFCRVNYVCFFLRTELCHLSLEERFS